MLFWMALGTACCLACCLIGVVIGYAIGRGNMTPRPLESIRRTITPIEQPPVNYKLPVEQRTRFEY